MHLFFVTVALFFFITAMLSFLIRRTAISPEVVVATVWFIVFLFASFDNIVILNVSVLSVLYIVVGVMSFIITSFFSSYSRSEGLKRRALKYRSRRSVDFFLVTFAYIVTFLLLLKAIKLSNSGPFESALSNIRWGVTGPDSEGYGFLAYFVTFLIVLASREIIRYMYNESPSYKSRLWFIISVLPGFFASFLSMGRGRAIALLIIFVLVGVFKSGKLKLKPLLFLVSFSLSIFVSVGVALSKIQMLGSDSSFYLFIKIREYVTYPLVAWSHIVASGSELAMGSYTFRFFQALAQKIGILSGSNTDTIRPFYESSEITTNLYTFLFPFFMDFGFPGAIIFPSILGVGIGKIFLRAKKGNGNPAWLIIYCFVFLALTATYSGEKFFLQISLWGQYFFWAYVLTLNWQFVTLDKQKLEQLK